LAQKSGLSKATALKYNTFLEENQILYICRTSLPSDDSGFLSRNYYGLYEDRSAIMSCGNHPVTEETRHRQSMAAKYNQLMSGYDGYSQEDIAAISAYCEEWNAAHPHDPPKLIPHTSSSSGEPSLDDLPFA
jgi:hypothetical protein